MDPSPTPPPIPESDFATASGVARADIKKLRLERLTFGEDWIGGNGTAVLLQPSGVAKLTEALQKNFAAQGDPPDVPAAVEAQRALYEPLCVVRVLNPRFLLARKKDAAEDVADSLVRVRVRDSKHFVPGMELALCEPQGGDLYCYHGRLPRRKGRL